MIKQMRTFFAQRREHVLTLKDVSMLLSKITAPGVTVSPSSLNHKTIGKYQHQKNFKIPINRNSFGLINIVLGVKCSLHKTEYLVGICIANFFVAIQLGYRKYEANKFRKKTTKHAVQI